ncbi:MAG: hypothetical protein ACREC6_07990 [Hyphomicrobiaceae bacterium]
MPLLTAKRDPHWIGCIDFGTAFSKCALVQAVDRAALQSEHVRPLSIGIGRASQSLNRYLLPSVVFVGDDRLLFGQDAESAALDAEQTGRYAFVSSKQYLSTRDFAELDRKLPQDIDPAAKFTPRDLLQLFLAYLLERAGNDAVEQSLPWPVPLRVARPAWDPPRAWEGEKILKALVLDAFALIDKLGSKLSAEGGLPQKAALAALRKLSSEYRIKEDKIFKLTSNGSASVPEATAVAAGAIRDTGRRVVVVADVGGGTSDFGAFMTGLPRRHVVAEILGSSRILLEAGDYLDRELRRYILSAVGPLADDPVARLDVDRLRRRARRNKEDLFSYKELVVQIGGDQPEISLERFLSDRPIQAFARRLRKRFLDTLQLAVSCAESFRQPNGSEPPVEIMLTGGGHALPMVRALYEKPGIPWKYVESSVDLVERPEDLDYLDVRPQLAVAIGGAMRDLPIQTAPLRP